MAQGGNNSMAFIVGGLVIAVAIIAYFVFGDGMEMVGGGDTTSVTVDTGDEPAGGTGGAMTDGADTAGETGAGTTDGGAEAPADNN